MLILFRKREEIRVSTEDAQIAAEIVERNQQWFAEEMEKAQKEKENQRKKKENYWENFRKNDALDLPFPYNLLFGELYSEDDANIFYDRWQFSNDYLDKLHGLCWAVWSLPAPHRLVMECLFNCGDRISVKEAAIILGYKVKDVEKYKKEGIALLKEGIRFNMWENGYKHTKERKAEKMEACMRESGAKEPNEPCVIEHFEYWWYSPFNYDPENEEDEYYSYFDDIY
jgi:hypothetical protein